MWFLLGGLVVLASVLVCLKRYKPSGCMSVLKAFELLRSVPNEPMPAQHVSGNVYVVSYLHDGQVYHLYFPIRSEVKEMFKGKDVYLILELVNANLNQEPGVPYYIQAGDFSSEAIISVISEDDEKVISFENNEDVTL